eukprot:gb/GECG01015366.1/.p1 GENE.gb/GECG01015366.1/~~gb/GECG01015366.1/.p1  ORF type:complete len:614 (+),score=62.42 gb/GECG01015366.1/:1-1842(+)
MGPQFLHSPLRPVLLLNLLSGVESLGHDLIMALTEHNFDIDGWTEQPEVLMRETILLLKHLYTEAIGKLDPELSPLVSSLPLVLIDEYDVPWRDFEMAIMEERTAGDAERKEELRQRSLRKKDQIGSMERTMLALKNLLPDNLYGVGIVSLLRHSDISSWDNTKDLCTFKEHHGMFGVSERDLSKCLDVARDDDVFNWTKVLLWASKFEIVTPNVDLAFQKQDFFRWLKNWFNTFCTGFRGSSGEVDPLYSPIDILELIRHTNGRWVDKSRLLWLQGARGAFSEVLSYHGRYNVAVEGLLGGSIDISELGSKIGQVPSTSANSPTHMKKILYNLGLLSVKRVVGPRVILSPVLEGKTSRMLDILFCAFRANLPKVTNDEMEKYIRAPERLVWDLYKLFPMAIKALQTQYGHLSDFGDLTEFSVQDRLCHIMYAYFPASENARFDGEGVALVQNVTHVGREQQMSMSLEIRPFHPWPIRREEMKPSESSIASKNEFLNRTTPGSLVGGKIYKPSGTSQPLWKITGVTFGCKVDRLQNNGSTSPMVDALRQAWDLREKMKRPGARWLMGITCSREDNDILKFTYCAGKFAERPQSDEDLKDGIMYQQCTDGKTVW